MHAHWKLGLACILSLLALGVSRAADAVSFGGGPSTIEAIFFPNDPSVVEVECTFSSSDDDIAGCAVELEGPEGVYVSLDRDSLVTYRDDYEETFPGSGRFKASVIMGRPGPDAELMGMEESGYNGVVYGKGLWPPPEGGGGLVVAAGARLLMKLRAFEGDPGVPQTAWTFENTSQYDIIDGYIWLIDPSNWYRRYINGLTIPAGASLTVVAQMGPEWEWAFGAVLDSPDTSPVFAFDSSGASPEGIEFNDVFPAWPYFKPASSGYMAAWAAEERGYGGYDCITTFSPPVDSTTSFDLFAFSDGFRVGGGSASPLSAPSPIPEPGTLSLLAAGCLGLLLRKPSRACA